MERSGTELKAKQCRTANCFWFSRKIYLDMKELFNLLFWTTLCFLRPILVLSHALPGVCLPFFWLGTGSYAFPILVPW